MTTYNMAVTGPAQVTAETPLTTAPLAAIAAELQARAEAQLQGLHGQGAPPKDPTLQAAALMQAAGVQLLRAAAIENEAAG